MNLKVSDYCFSYFAILAFKSLKIEKKQFKERYDQNVKPRSYVEGNLVLVYDQEHNNLGIGKFEPMWHGPYIVKRALAKGPMNKWIMTKFLWESPEMVFT